MMGPPPGYAPPGPPQQQEWQDPFGEVVLPPDEALTGYAARAAEKRAERPKPNQGAPQAKADASKSPEKKNGPAGASLPAVSTEDGSGPDGSSEPGDAAGPQGTE